MEDRGALHHRVVDVEEGRRRQVGAGRQRRFVLVHGQVGGLGRGGAGDLRGLRLFVENFALLFFTARLPHLSSRFADRCRPPVRSIATAVPGQTIRRAIAAGGSRACRVRPGRNPGLTGCPLDGGERQWRSEQPRNRRQRTIRLPRDQRGRPAAGVRRQRHPDRPAVIETTGSRTWAELDAAVDAGVAAFRSLGVAPGERVVMTLPTGADLALALFAVARAGLIAVPLGPSRGDTDVFADRVGALAAISEEQDHGAADLADRPRSAVLVERLVGRRSAGGDRRR